MGFLGDKMLHLQLEAQHSAQNKKAQLIPQLMSQTLFSSEGLLSFLIHSIILFNTYYLPNSRPSTVNTMMVKGKEKRVGAHSGRRPDWKKAIVTIDTNPAEVTYLGQGGKEG